MRSLTELRSECDDRGIQWNEKHGRTDLEELLADQADLDQIEPMTAHDFKDYDERMQMEILGDENWVSEEKLDGVRMKAHVTPEGGLRLDGRRKSDKTYRYTERTANFPHLCDIDLFKGLEGTVFDCELLLLKGSINTGSVITAGTLTSTTAVTTCAPEKSVEIQRVQGLAQLFIFDLIRFKGKLVSVDLSKRREAVKRILETRKHDQISILPQRRDAKAHYQETVEGGGEGIMLKYLYGDYRVGKRVRTMLKWKKVYNYEAFITGYVEAKKGKGWEGLVGALEVSVYWNGNLHRIGAPQPGTLKFRKEISEPNGSLKHVYYGQVVEIRGNEFTKNGRLRHCVLLGDEIDGEWTPRFRPDKNKEDCVVDIDQELKKLKGSR